MAAKAVAESKCAAGSALSAVVVLADRVGINVVARDAMDESATQTLVIDLRKLPLGMR